ncbi:uncharacterized protein MELLADRAFT_67385 [Melampsora larici-populina 98AG31]|uniref:Uncharacterized protein n=1 Tax=Melampsora larici-populina (strain 98AG31 / pathotype 3-4-7) TaxID=747676 RepID=F4S2Z0_MELLP|nr:uncharacterized protein MELLADRAFT_67385 [Melampsora larici-populina 98AG31]EGG00886.1 hypothetical protein MELLADRAFT_67385 [Melampsora larici-populina 98AG31]
MFGQTIQMLEHREFLSSFDLCCSPTSVTRAVVHVKRTRFHHLQLTQVLHPIINSRSCFRKIRDSLSSLSTTNQKILTMLSAHSSSGSSSEYQDATATNPDTKNCTRYPEASANDKDALPNANEDLMEIIDYEKRSRCGLGHPHRPALVDMPGSFPEFADKMFATHIKLEDGPLASAANERSQSPPPNSTFEASEKSPEFRSLSPTRSLNDSTSQDVNLLRQSHGLQGSVDGAERRRLSRSPSPTRSVQYQPSAYVDRLQSLHPRQGSETEVFRSLQISTSPDGSLRQRSHALQSSAGQKRRQSRSPSPTRSVQYQPSVYVDRPQSLQPRRGSGLQSSVGGAGKKRRQSRSPSPTRSVQYQPSVYVDRRQSLQPRRGSGLQSSVHGAGEKRRQSRTPSPVRNLQYRRSGYVSRLQSLEPRRGLESAAFRARKEGDQIQSSAHSFQKPVSAAADRLQSRHLGEYEIQSSNKRPRSPSVTRSFQNSQFSSPSPIHSLQYQPSRYANRLQPLQPLQPTRDSRYSDLGARKNGNQTQSSSHSFQKSVSGASNHLQSRYLEKPHFEASTNRNPYNSSPPPNVAKILQSRSPPPHIKESASVAGSINGEIIEKQDKAVAMASTSGCQCRLSTTRAILASGLPPLELLLKSNICDGQLYKETAQIFFRMFDEVRLVQDCDEHVQSCPNFVI